MKNFQIILRLVVPLATRLARLSFPTRPGLRSQRLCYGGVGSGIQAQKELNHFWIPAFAGMTEKKFQLAEISAAADASLPLLLCAYVPLCLIY